ncbi:MAG: diacylglycerol kinase [Propionibacteriales bacterium]|nr:diacylglycerol kinase [Propionibacteriales bacterium]
MRDAAVLVNPTAGRGKGARVGMRTLRLLRERGITAHALVGRDADESADLARVAVEKGTDALVLVGGDGLVHQALQVVAGTPVPVGLVPAGTGNDVARYFGVPRRDTAAAVNVIAAGGTRTVDLASANGTLFVTVLASGFDSFVNERANAMTWPRGQARYNLAVAAELRRLQSIRYTLELDGEVRTVDATLVAVGNGPSYGGGLRMCEGAVLDDGLLDVVVIRPVGRAELVRVFPRLYAGSHVTHPKYEHHLVRRVTVAAAGVVAYADGERVGPLPMTVECIPGALTVFAPPTP